MQVDKITTIRAELRSDIDFILEYNFLYYCNYEREATFVFAVKRSSKHSETYTDFKEIKISAESHCGIRLYGPYGPAHISREIIDLSMFVLKES
jgi:hypothetical protein